MFLVYFLYVFNLKAFFALKSNVSFKKMYSFLNKKWYFDRLYNQYITQPTLSVSYFYTYKDIDRGLVEKVGPWGIISAVKEITKIVKVLQSGFIYYYLYIFILSFFLILSFSW
jgi:NADH:ubiquinone oxidoreductase subunit 5 (subunit L)/multisubunit Na+/H+ antiporter MnhA subunit